MEDFMEGVELPVSPQEMREAWDYFWRKESTWHQLARKGLSNNHTAKDAR